jgi:hypothetical protein
MKIGRFRSSPLYADELSSLNIPWKFVLMALGPGQGLDIYLMDDQHYLSCYQRDKNAAPVSGPSLSWSAKYDSSGNKDKLYFAMPEEQSALLLYF